jgi:HlyD family secretion protein
MQNEESHVSGKEEGEAIPAPSADSPSENALVEEHLGALPSPVARGLIYLAVLMAIAFFLYSFIARVDMIAECRAVIRPSTDIMRVQADRSGYIEQIFISEGDIVEPGDPLFRIRSKETVGYVSKAEDLQERLPLTERNYDVQISAARGRRTQQVEKHENTKKVNGLKLEQNSLNRASIDSDLSYWRNQAIILADEVERLRKGRERGYASLPEYNRAVSEWERAKTEEKKLVSQQEINAREQEILKAEIQREERAFANELVQIDNEIENLELDKKAILHTMHSELTLNRKLLEIQKNDAVSGAGKTEADAVIRAGMKGAVSEIGFRNPGELVGISDVLCTLVPAGSPLFMDITVSNKDIGFIEEGMTVKYRFDAYPSADYGLLTGAVAFIAPSAVESQGQGFVYHIRGSLPQPFFTIRGREYPVKAGMTATAEVVTERISIFSLLFRKLKR